MRGHRGFTLVELLIVMVIIAILVSIAIPVYLSARKKAQEATCTMNLVKIHHALTAYRQDFGFYPSVGEVVGNEDPMGTLVAAKLLEKVLTCPLDREEEHDTYGEFYNYYGFYLDPVESNRRMEPLLNPSPVEAREAYTLAESKGYGKQLWYSNTLEGADGPHTNFPGLANRNAPANTIVTLCPQHVSSRGRYNILRMDGSTEWGVPQSKTFWVMSETTK